MSLTEKTLKYLSTLSIAIFLVTPSSAGAIVHHDLTVNLLPEEHRIVVTDTITLESRVSEFGFYLDPNLAPSVAPEDGGVTRELIAAPGLVVLKSEAPRDRWSLSYEGNIDYPLTQVGEEYARGQKETAGSIGPEGIYLNGGSGWYPRLVRKGGQVHGQVTFDLSATVPAGWSSVSQGERKEHSARTDDTAMDRWVCDQPQDGIWLVGGKYHEYSETFGKVQAMAFFRQAEGALAGKYLAATGEFITMYEKLIGPYPYKKFALVENFWETGYGMPSFTLLGPRVIRFPFIIESSYPHEILHNWWGNSVYIDYGSGNWGEGLTAYLSDHLLKEQKGLGVQHRQESLQKYADYVLSERDLPLAQFRSRHGSVSEAVGYGKTMMMFHMLRQELGDGLFQKGLGSFYSGNLYKTAAFDDLQAAFEVVSGRDLGWFFEQWVHRTGAPELELGDPDSQQLASGSYSLSLALKQMQDGEPYRLNVPVAVTVEGQKEARMFTVTMEGAELSTTLSLPARPLRVDVDPSFDLFRRLDRREIPPAMTQAFGSQKALIVLPADAPPDLLDSYRLLARSLTRTGPGRVEVTDDSKLADIPSDSSVWLVGWENGLLEKIVPAFNEYRAILDSKAGKVEITGQAPVELLKGENSVILAGRHPKNPDLAVLWIAADNAAAHEGLARKLPHYHKYSYLGFTGDAPDNMAKGRWPVVGSPLSAVVDANRADHSSVPMGELPAGVPLIDRPVPFSADRMMNDIRYLATEEMKGRGVGTKEMDEAAQYIADRFEEIGLQPTGENGSWFQEWSVDGPLGPATLKNVVGVIPGSLADWKGQSVVVGAHYDHLGLGMGEGGLAINKGRVHPGADDNASGVAAMLELAKVLKGGSVPKRSILFVAFTAEETGKLGSGYYVENPGQYPVDKVMGMVNLDTVGRLGDGKVLVLGGDSAEEWIHIFRGAGYVTGVDVQVVTKSLDSSDHIIFIDAGVPAVQLFTGAHAGYHKPYDTVEKIDPEGLVKVGQVAKEAVEYLASREAPLTGARRGERESGRGGDPSKSSGQGPTRKVSLGTVPDFSYEGEGVRLDGTLEGSPAEKAGMQKGDVIKAVGGHMVKELRDLSDILKGLRAGDKVDILVDRNGEPIIVKAILEIR